MAKPAPVIPFVVVEAVTLRLARLRPGSVRIVGGSDRLRRLVSSDVLAEVAEVSGLPADAVVFVCEPDAPSQQCRQHLADAAALCRGNVVLAERSAPGVGIGEAMLRQIDPGAQTIESDELPSRIGGTRGRRSWEAPQRWLIAQAAAWRFASQAEVARAGFRARLPRLAAAQIVTTCRRILHRFSNAHECFALAAEEFGRRSDAAGLASLAAELQHHGAALPDVQLRLRTVSLSLRADTEPANVPTGEIEPGRATRGA